MKRITGTNLKQKITGNPLSNIIKAKGRNDFTFEVQYGVEVQE